MKSNEHKDKVFFGESLLEELFEQTALKQTLTSLSTTRYIMRAIMAGIIIAFGYVAYILIDAKFGSVVDGKFIYNGLGHFLACGFFAFCLIFIYYVKAELLTSNMMVFSVSTYYKKTTIKYSLIVLGFCYIGNLLGGLFIGLLLSKTTILTDPVAVANFKHVLETKQTYSTSLAGIYDMFIRAVFCNFFINLSMITVYAKRITSDSGKMLIIFGGVFFFMFLGLEHSVANTTFFAIAGFMDLFNPALEIGFNFSESFINIVVAIIGNFVGGGLLIGVYYAFLNDKEKVLKNEI